MKRFLYITICLLAVVLHHDALAQSMPERGLVRKGNRQFSRERYDLSADSYRRALEHDSTSFEARYDLANAMIRTERYAEAEELLKVASVDSLRTKQERAEAFYNLGNAQFAQQKLQEALKSYRSSLILNPDDQEAKYNYAYTKKLLEQNQNQDQNQDQNQNQNQDQNQDQNQQGGGENQPQGGDQNQDKNDQNKNNNKDQGDQNQDQQGDQNKDPNKDQQGDGQGDQNEDKRDGQQPPPRSGMNREQQEQLLNAIQAQEDKTQEKLDEKAKGVVVKGRKNW